MGLRPAAPAGLASRRLALEVLARIFDRRQTLDEAVAATAGTQALDPRDRAFLLALVFAVLRHRGEAEAVLARFLSRALPRKSGRAPLILLLGATQLLFLGQPPHAVIDLAVTEAKADAGARHFAGLVNAVLRKVATEGAGLLQDLDGPRLATPDWLWQRWVKTYGAGTAHAMAAAHQQEAPLDLTLKADAASWATRLGGQLLPTGSLRLAPAPASVEALAGFDSGEWWVQDAAAAIPARLAGDVRGRCVLDLCAAPGGKTLQVAAAGAQVTAVDIAEARLRRVGDNLRRCRLEAELVAADAADYAPQRTFDIVLLDAPCSATGTIRRHPDLPYVKTAVQIAELAAQQRRLLDHAAGLVRPGGLLVYCTCSLEPDEGEHVIARALARHRDLALVPVAAGEAGIPATMVTPEGYFRSLPSQDLGLARGLDGFFAARLTRAL
jgi:16S rRNA (cytosine967-C5)-methyltransferase